MNNARTIHLRRLDGCSSYDCFAKNAPVIVTPAKMPVPTVLSGVEQSHAPAGLGVLGCNLRTLRIVTNRARVAQVVRLSLATQRPRHDVIDFERFGTQLLLQLTVFAAEFRALGATYHTGSVAGVGFEPDVIVECTGVGQVIADAIQGVGAGGVVCLTGVGTGGHTTRVATADVAAQAVLRNNVVVGSVNANKRHWYKAGEALARADRSWLARLVTRREQPEDFVRALQRTAEDIKVVVQFAEA